MSQYDWRYFGILEQKGGEIPNGLTVDRINPGRGDGVLGRFQDLADAQGEEVMRRSGAKMSIANIPT